jgi:hypothetical protein
MNKILLYLKQQLNELRRLTEAGLLDKKDKRYFVICALKFTFIWDFAISSYVDNGELEYMRIEWDKIMQEYSMTTFKDMFELYLS